MSKKLLEVLSQAGSLKVNLELVDDINEALIKIRHKVDEKLSARRNQFLKESEEENTSLMDEGFYVKLITDYSSDYKKFTYIHFTRVIKPFSTAKYGGPYYSYNQFSFGIEYGYMEVEDLRIYKEDRCSKESFEQIQQSYKDIRDLFYYGT